MIKQVKIFKKQKGRRRAMLPSEKPERILSLWLEVPDFFNAHRQIVQYEIDDPIAPDLPPIMRLPEFQGHCFNKLKAKYPHSVDIRETSTCYIITEKVHSKP